LPGTRPGIDEVASIVIGTVHLNCAGGGDLRLWAFRWTPIDRAVEVVRRDQSSEAVFLMHSHWGERGGTMGDDMPVRPRGGLFNMTKA